MSKHIVPSTRVQNLEFQEAFKLLSTKEKNYAYWLSKAAWAGAKVVPHQISYESAPLMVLFQAYFQSRDFYTLRKKALERGITAEEWANFIAYVGGFYGNMSNYHSFGGLKFVPDLDPTRFNLILESNPLFSDPKSGYKDLLKEVLPQIEKEIFAYDKPYKQINFPHEGGVTAYFGQNLVKEDLDLVRDFLKE